MGGCIRAAFGGIFDVEGKLDTPVCRWQRPNEAGSVLSRAVRASGYKLPGTITIPDQIVSNRQPYYEALDAADAAWAKGMVDVSVMEQLLAEMLANQLSSVIDAAMG